MSRIIALYSPYHGAGKSTAAGCIRDNASADLVSFAQDLHGIANTLIELKTGSPMWEKDEPLEGFPDGITARDFMVAIGQAARSVYWDIWVDIARKRIEHSLSTGRNVVVDDVRMANEYDMLRSMGAVMVRLTRKGMKIQHTATEGLLEGKKWDIQLVNDAGSALGFYKGLREKIKNGWGDL